MYINVREYRRAIKNGQSREIGNIGYTKRRKTKQKHNTICVGRNYTQTNTNNVNRTRALIQTTRATCIYVVCCFNEPTLLKPDFITDSILLLIEM